jgi:hypothetical protein
MRFNNPEAPQIEQKTPSADSLNPLPLAVYDIDKTGISWYNYADGDILFGGAPTALPVASKGC